MAPPDSAFLRRLQQGVLVCDGAMGTSLHEIDLSLADYRGCENCPEVLNLSRPDVVGRIHRTFLEAGCDAVETNTFGGMKHVLREFDLHEQTAEINREAARIALAAARECATSQQPRFVLGSMGPGTKLVTLRQISYDEMLDSYHVQARALLETGVDGLIIETCQDILQCKCAIHAARLAMQGAGRRVPLIVQVTMETTGTMLVGTDMAAALTTIEVFPEVDLIGLNCATGPQEMSEHVRYLAGASTRPISIQPNAGLPQLVQGRAHFPLTPVELARWLREFIVKDGVSLVGGCCGTTPEHLRAVVEAVRGLQPGRRTVTHEPASSSLYQSQPHRQQNSFLIVGERCNTNGSRKFKELLAAGDIDGCAEMGREQVQEGAHVLDVCVDYVGRDGVPDMHNVVDRFAKDVTVPLMLDSTETPVLEAGLKLAGGKCIINSVNLEEGEHKLDKVCPLLRQYGAAVVALTIDEHPTEAMAKTAERKEQIAARLHDLLTRKWGLPEEDIFFDCLTFPVTTGNQEDRRLALETLEGIERISARFPRCQSILGVSNVSFGLVPAARVVLNSAFLHEARLRGLTAAIVHASKILPRNRISDERWHAALDLIYDRSPDALGRYIGLFSAEEKLGVKPRMDDLPLEERLKRRIIDGNRIGLETDLAAAMQKYPPLEIINTFLLDGMKVVGELFGAGQMQLPFVLKSAETMKAAVSLLEPHMEKSSGMSRGRIVLATVRGDVHDIGKNLVDIILTNNGYTVYNLGIKQPIANIISAMRDHGADAIGLSGLLVKSTLVMRDDLHVLNEQGIATPVILGGAALTRRYVEEDLRAIYCGPLFYARDAFDGLHLMGQIAAQNEDLLVAATGGGPRREVAQEPGAAAPRPVGKPRDEGAGECRPPGGGGRPSESSLVAKSANEKLTLELEQRYGLRDVADDEALEPAPANVRGTPEATAAVQASGAVSAPEGSRGAVRTIITHAEPVPTPPFWGARVLERIPLKAVLAYLNEVMLFQVQWGFRKRGRGRDEFKKYIDLEVRPIYRELVARCEREQILQPQAVYGYWPCNSDGNDLVVYAPPTSDAPSRTQEIMRFTFPRQHKSPQRCLSDFWRPVQGDEVDVVAFHIVTAGRRVSAAAREWFARNEYQQYLYLHGLGVETAEALAEYIHKQVRMELGIAGQDAREISKLFQQGYQGSRYSFGYPACPALEDQAKLMTLLQPDRIGITLSEEYQLEPEQSTSAIVAHHPAARYFNVR